MGAGQMMAGQAVPNAPAMQGQAAVQMGPGVPGAPVQVAQRVAVSQQPGAPLQMHTMAMGAPPGMRPAAAFSLPNGQPRPVMANAMPPGMMQGHPGMPNQVGPLLPLVSSCTARAKQLHAARGEGAEGRGVDGRICVCRHSCRRQEIRGGQGRERALVNVSMNGIVMFPDLGVV